jgi:hypothetical protein
MFRGSAIGPDHEINIKAALYRLETDESFANGGGPASNPGGRLTPVPVAPTQRPE